MFCHFKRLIILLLLCTLTASAQTPIYDQTRDGFLVFHPIKSDAAGHIVSWYSADSGEAFDFVINQTWKFWDCMRADLNGLPYYMNHQVWRPDINDRRGIGGDQLSMALSSWHLLYQYSGSEKVKENMKFIADYYLSHSLSPSDAEWSDIPYPYNTLIYSGIYDGDMIIGKDYTQPDKAGSFGDELITLYKMTGNARYLDAAVKIANTLAVHTTPGDNDHSPMPFKVNAMTGEIGKLTRQSDHSAVVGESIYTSNYAGTLQLFEKLIEMEQGNGALYEKAHSVILSWMKEYPMKTNKWGPFFEDIAGWSDTQINAVTFARYIMLHPQYFPNWKQDVQNITGWVYKKLGDDTWKEYGVCVVHEQTAYPVPGNSHTSRQAAADLLYASLTGENERAANAVRQLHWATYMVDEDGKNNYPRDEVWLTDGYGDYVRHYLRAMQAMPELAPKNQNHILHSTSVLAQVDYAPYFNTTLVADIPYDEVNKTWIYYRTFDDASVETIRMQTKPSAVIAIYDKALEECQNLERDGWIWESMEIGGLLRVKHSSSRFIKIMK